MSAKSSEVDAYLAGSEAWHDELAALRAVVLDCPVAEAFKWRSPCYTFDDGNVVALWRLKDCCALAFFKGALLSGSEGALDAPGENSRSMRVMKFTSVPEIVAAEAAIRRLVQAAIDVEKAGLKVEFRKDDLPWPEELTERLESDPDLKAAFDSLTPGRRRGYVLHFSRAKQAKTRVTRIERCAPRIRDGKGLHDR